MTATLTLHFGEILTPDEQRELLDETLRRRVRIEEIVVEALRLRRQQGLPPQPTTSAKAA